MRFLFPINFGGVFELAIIVGVVLLIVSLTRKKQFVTIRTGEGDEGVPGQPRRHGPPPLPPGRIRERPTVAVAQLVFAIIFLPFVLVFWGLASLGDLVAIPVHVAVGTVTGAVALLFSLVGAYPRRLLRVCGRQYTRSGQAAWSVFVRLLSTFGLGGLIDRVKEDARDAGEPAATFPRAGKIGAAGENGRTYPFEDRYRIESTLGTGGSTARIFVVRRVEGNRPVGDRLALKYFDMGLGSRLEEVIRESRGMQVAKEMGIVLDHHLAEDHFYYVMPYYEGETLTRAAARIHRTLAPDEEMPAEDMKTCLGWVAELLRILDGYHRHGVIHKDVKPDNVIVTDQGIRLVDLGLLTPLTSAMTLTTHGTEYFRDPEMVKLAVQGKRVRDVVAVRFDVYSAGAALYYLLEGSFPACGPLSRFSRPVPMALSILVSRAMAEGEKRYRDVAAMRADLDAVLRALSEEGLASYPVSRLPSMSGKKVATMAPPVPPPAVRAAGPAPVRRGRSPVLIVLAAFFVAGAVMFGTWFGVGSGARSDRDSPFVPAEAAPVAAERGEFRGEDVADAVELWRQTLEVTHDQTGSGTSLSSVPVLIVADDSEAVAKAAGVAERELVIRQVPLLTSLTLRESVRKILEAGGESTEVAEKVAAAAAPDEPPMVLWIRDLGYVEGEDARQAELRFRYGNIIRSQRMVIPGPAGGRR